KDGFVSVWVGEFPSLDAAEEYFGIPDEVGVYLPPDAFAADLDLNDLPPENLEVHFEQLKARPLSELLRDATCSASFLAAALESANEQGIYEAQGVALLYDFDYEASPDQKRTAGPLTFLGTFQFFGFLPQRNQPPVLDPRIKMTGPQDNIL